MFESPCTNKRPPNDTSEPTRILELKLESAIEIIPKVAVNCPDVFKVVILAVGIVAVPVNVGDAIDAFAFNEVSKYAVLNVLIDVST